MQPRRTKSDKVQLNSLVRALLELSGGRVDLQQHGFAQEYTFRDNAELYASVLDITGKATCENYDPEKIYQALSESPVFSDTTTSTQDLEDRLTKIMNFLPIGFSILDPYNTREDTFWSSSGQLDLFNIHL